MNKIYKVKKNAAGHLVACSEFAKGHTKKAVLGSLLIVGILGMATTASAQLVSQGNTNRLVGPGNTNRLVGPGNNLLDSSWSIIGAGRSNIVGGSAHNSGILSGYKNMVNGYTSAIVGGYGNQAWGNYTVVGGGNNNQATGNNSTVAGGSYNRATGVGSFATGTSNHATGGMSTISGGGANKATGSQSSIGGGVFNQATGDNSTVAGGYYNKATGEKSTIAGGSHNQAEGKGSFAAGVENQANTENAVAVGKKNIINGDNSVVIGSDNTVETGKKDVFILGSGTTGVTSNSVLLGNKTAGKQATTVENATVGDLSLTKFAGASKLENGVVSVGSEGGERQIVNVGAGQISATSTDAVNGSQLHALASTIDEEVGAISEEVGALGDEIADINDELEGFAAHVDTQDKQILQNQADIAKNNDSIEDLYEATNENLDKISQLDGAVFNNTQNIAKNSNHIKTLESNVEEGLLDLSGRLLDQKADIDNNINNIYELAQQQDQHSSDIKTLKNNVEEGLLDLSGRLIDQKADIAKNQADIAQNQTDIQDLAAYNELQDAYAKQQTDAIDALNKASSANTDRIATAELGIAENKKDAQIAKAQANENKDGIAKNQADIQLHDKKITNLGILHSMVARAVGNNTQGVATNKADIAKNQADIANNIKNIYELAQQQDQHSSDIKTLAKVSAANTDRIAKNKAEADASFETLTKNQNTLIEQGEALVEQNKAINQELEGFAAHADVQDKQILQNQADITTNKTAIEQNINRTVANGFEIEKNKAGIATNKQELILQNDRLNRINETNNHQDQKIDQLGYALKEQGQHFNNRISAVERQTAGGIANAIAIATLPSPSRAGEHHVLFGSGYHNGQAAVSLGAAGLSDTGKSTYKIGLSWSDAGGLSGGVGGSYRWK
ncbi:uspA1 [Moraxella catarrhalis]|uniref:YadA-like family protein n=1 Tax=Moraxella catarrhalis TaxID=480 RepID=UPI000F851C00|nr:YadA-like family protein [Moraxella catarrhalis]AZQ90781.1 uspA1 [Moraxella catarrhalis]